MTVYIPESVADEVRKQIALGKPKRLIERNLGLSYGLLDRRWVGRDEDPKAKAKRLADEADWLRRFEAYERIRAREIRDQIAGIRRDPEDDD